MAKPAKAATKPKAQMPQNGARAIPVTDSCRDCGEDCAADTVCQRQCCAECCAANCVVEYGQQHNEKPPQP